MIYADTIIEKLLEKFRIILDRDFDKYRNHVYRVFLACLLMDQEDSNRRKYAIASVFHDIGIWTDHTIDYIDPSVHQVRIYLAETGQQSLAEEIEGMIYWHHKLGKYTGEYRTAIEVFRKADWIDVSLGILNFGVDRYKLRRNRKMLPRLGFHLFLLKKLSKNFIRHPLNPLPMFKS